MISTGTRPMLRYRSVTASPACLQPPVPPTRRGSNCHIRRQQHLFRGNRLAACHVAFRNLLQCRLRRFLASNAFRRRNWHFFRCLLDGRLRCGRRLLCCARRLGDSLLGHSLAYRFLRNGAARRSRGNAVDEELRAISDVRNPGRRTGVTAPCCAGLWIPIFRWQRSFILSLASNESWPRSS